MRSLFIPCCLLLCSSFIFSNCEGGLEPPMEEPNPIGVITGIVNYSGEWPPEVSLIDLRFVALETKPQSATDIVSVFPNLPFSETLNFNVERDTFFIDSVQNGVFIYNSIAQQFGGSILQDWRPVGLYEENDGIIIVNGDTVSITISVDFNNLPPFPPE